MIATIMLHVARSYSANNSRAIIITLVTELCASRIGGRIKFEGKINSRKYGIRYTGITD